MKHVFFAMTIAALSSISCSCKPVGNSAPGVYGDVYEIDLYEINGLNLRGTQPLCFDSKLDEGEDAQIVKKINQSLMGHDPDEPTHIFAVSGVGLDALKRACDVLVDRQQPQSSFSRDESLSIVFL